MQVGDDIVVDKAGRQIERFLAVFVAHEFDGPVGTGVVGDREEAFAHFFIFFKGLSCRQLAQCRTTRRNESGQLAIVLDKEVAADDVDAAARQRHTWQ